MITESGFIEIKVKFKQLRYHNNGFAIFSAISEAYGAFSAKGKIIDDPHHLLDVNLSLIGKFVPNIKYGGKDFEFNRYAIEEDQLYHFLMRVVGHITSASARDICKRFGSNIDEVIEKTPNQLLSIKGIGPKKLIRILDSWKANRHLFQLSRMLSPFGVNTNQIIRIHEHFGEESFDILLINPYKLVEIRGIGFKIADGIARKIGIPHDSPERMVACAEYTLTKDDGGHTVFLPQSVIQSMQQELQTELNETATYEQCAQGIANLIDDGRARFTSERTDEPVATINVIDGVNANNEIAMERNFKYESAIVEGLDHIVNGNPIVDDIDAWILTYEKNNNVLFGDEQQDAIKLANKMHRIFSISGYAGTGKTTTSKAILALITQRLHSDEVACCALAGIAANRIQMQSGYPASTIHSLLGYKGSSWTFNVDNKLPHKLIMLDESSMVDVSLMYRLFQAIDFKRTTLIMLGDPAQLPPVGLGQPYADLLNFKLIPNVTLTRIYRQSEDAVITLYAGQVRVGRMPNTQKNFEDFKWHDHSIENYRSLKNKLPKNEYDALRNDNNKKIHNTIINLAKEAKADVTSLLDDNNWWEFITRFQVVSPVKKTSVGVNELNTQLQDVFNPLTTSQLIRSADKRVFRAGDKVVHLRNQWMRQVNDYELALWRNDDLPEQYSEEDRIRVMNGQLGIVNEVVGGEMLVYFPIEKNLILYNEAAINSMTIDLGYALTVHKTQGSEYEQVVMPVTMSHYMMLSPKLIYTAMTRAKSRLDMVGQREAFSSGVNKIDDNARRTCIQSWCKTSNKLKNINP